MATNDITGDNIATRFGDAEQRKKFEDNFDLIFRKKESLCKVCGKDLKSTKECAWTSCPLHWDEERIDVIGQNGNVGYKNEP